MIKIKASSRKQSYNVPQDQVTVKSQEKGSHKKSREKLRKVDSAPELRNERQMSGVRANVQETMHTPEKKHKKKLLSQNQLEQTFRTHKNVPKRGLRKKDCINYSK